jgi:hypothetical protein
MEGIDDQFLISLSPNGINFVREVNWQSGTRKWPDRCYRPLLVKSPEDREFLGGRGVRPDHPETGSA